LATINRYWPLQRNAIVNVRQRAQSHAVGNDDGATHCKLNGGVPARTLRTIGCRKQQIRTYGNEAPAPPHQAC
jgi:hypothetical protein